MKLSLRQAREQAKLTQLETSFIIGVEVEELARYETYEASPFISTAKKMARAYKLDINQIIWIM